MLVDAGPLVAVIDAGEPDHEVCVRELAGMRAPLITTWPAFTEAMYLLGRAGNPAGPDALWRLLFTERLVPADLSSAAVKRSAELMRRYADLPMDLADATLVALAEERKERQIFTLASDFHVYRINGRTRFEVVPSLS